MHVFCKSLVAVTALAGATLSADARIAKTQAEAAGVQACTLISPEEASAATGLTFLAYSPDDEREATQDSDCSIMFKAVDGVNPIARVVMVRFKTPEAAMEYWRDANRPHDGDAVHKVEGVGEDAYYHGIGNAPHDPKTGFMLSVLISPNVIAISTRDESAPAISMDAVIALAKAAIN